MAVARRIAAGDIEALADMTGLADEIDAAAGEAVTGLRDLGYSWSEIGTRLGITRQAAQQRWGTVIDRRDSSPYPRTTLRLGDRGRPPTTPARPWADFRAWERQLAATGACSHPIQLPAAPTPSTSPPANSPPCTTPRLSPAACCSPRAATAAKPSAPPARQVYKRDARQLVRAGLAGGKGIPDTVTAHPCAFATLTAPSFGPVHSRRMRGKTVLPCRPRRDANARRCPHGRDISCPRRHGEDDPRLGRPLCGDCYDYDAAVLFNAYAGDLWRRFTTYLPRHFARRLGVTQKQLRSSRIRYVKVAEYQARGVVHFHAIIRLDAPGDNYQPPPPASPPPCCATPSARPPPPSASPPARSRPPGRHAAVRHARPTPGPSATRRSCPAPARR